ncbi:S-adenosyl-L-methionine-dependent methyltransferase [Suhomyces tanzawaensis NRRL Y-17324]|uniref:S-adenosyl-L-methionine-dependent methyltransferase n=1 Tax=Suhomyces tanzawaensis NRRL Y-17324 TaxID=984487 RepID=A0A1E4SPG9_9ASCO|nr:S-adenosyl-L-methionine-dependent methyltransferase [Suhomyces tanzawaensis NRRL Y-17324]ODV81403.1 S-adenosyl-L-methionine-dependent methyltransferase [Suhomyces tanzawaensis NRRL Y-17324]
MATYSDKTFNASHYESARPSYPQSLYDELIKYHGDQAKELAIDIGCGSGFVAFKLTDYFTEVIGTDPSTVMIQQCQQDARAGKGITFKEGTGESLPVQSSVADMITGAECCHWVDHNRFFKEAARVLKPHGTLAYWFYKDPIFIGHPKANKIYHNYTWRSSLEDNPDDEFERWMGAYYEQPGHNFLGTLTKEIEVPEELFYDTTRVEYLVDENGDPKGIKDSPLMIKKTITIATFLEYVKSWSAYHAWMKDHGRKYDVAERFVDELKTEMGWTDDTKVDVVWDTMYTFAKRRA